MKCHKCGSSNLAVVKSGPHNKLVCTDCLAFQKFLSAGDARTFLQLQTRRLQATSLEAELNRFTNPVEGDIQDREEVTS